MKNPTPKQIAIASSISLSVILLIILLIVKFVFYKDLMWYVILIVAFFSLFFGYLIFNYFLEKFIYRKIKVIYKTIHEHKAAKGSILSKIDIKKEIINEVEQEVLEWVQKNKEEVEHYKKLESYRKDFLGNVSHELKTPIFNIQGYIETLIDGGIKDDKINIEYLYNAAKNVDRLNNIVEDLEMMSLIEDGELNLEMEKFNICELSDEVFESLKKQADTKNIKLGYKEGCYKTTYVVADKERIRQVLINLIGNSIKYGIEKGLTLIGFYDMDKNILIEVSDNGIGIERKNIKRLFERFYRVDKERSREQGGTGLGLSIVKHIIEAHKQAVTVRSTTGIGSTFGFTLKKA